jgi:hypothetical protein
MIFLQGSIAAFFTHEHLKTALKRWKWKLSFGVLAIQFTPTIRKYYQPLLIEP